MVRKHITEPLGALVEKPYRDIRKLLRDFLTDSTMIGALLMVLQHPGPEILKTAAAAGAISAGARYILRDKSRKRVLPSSLLLTGIREMKAEYEEVQMQLNSISVEQLSLPKVWQSP